MWLPKVPVLGPWGWRCTAPSACLNRMDVIRTVSLSLREPTRSEKLVGLCFKFIALT